MSTPIPDPVGLADLLAAVPEPSEDEVSAAIYAYRSGDWGSISPDFDSLLVGVRVGIRDDMRIALHAAAMVRAIQGAGAVP